MFGVIGGILGWVVKNIALLVGIIEAIAKVITGIITLTPTKKDDEWLPKIDAFFSSIKAWLYKISESLAGKST